MFPRAGVTGNGPTYFRVKNRTLKQRVVGITVHGRGRWCRQRRPLWTERVSETAATQTISFPCHQNDAQYRLQLWLHITAHQSII